MELGALVYGNSDGPTKKAGMAALKFLFDHIHSFIQLMVNFRLKGWDKLVLM